LRSRHRRDTGRGDYARSIDRSIAAFQESRESSVNLSRLSRDTFLGVEVAGGGGRGHLGHLETKRLRARTHTARRYSATTVKLRSRTGVSVEFHGGERESTALSASRSVRHRPRSSARILRTVHATARSTRGHVVVGAPRKERYPPRDILERFGRREREVAECNRSRSGNLSGGKKKKRSRETIGRKNCESNFIERENRIDRETWKESELKEHVVIIVISLCHRVRRGKRRKSRSLVKKKRDANRDRCTRAVHGDKRRREARERERERGRVGGRRKRAPARISRARDWARSGGVSWANVSVRRRPPLSLPRASCVSEPADAKLT